MKKAALVGLKALVSGTLLWLMLRHIDSAEVEAKIAEASAWLLVTALLLVAAAVALTALRWQLILAVGGKRFELARLIPYAFTGFFLNQALPSSIGGDGMRAWLVYRDGASPSLAIRSVLIERGLGLFVLVLFVAAGLPGLMQALELDLSQIIALELAAVFGIAAGVGLLHVFRRSPQLDRFFLGRGLRALATDAIVLLSRPRAALFFVIITLLGQVLGCVTVWCIGLAVDSPVALVDALIVMPAVFLILGLPVSIGGWGVREGAMVIGLGLVGVSAASAVLISILFGLLNLAVGLVGGAVWLIGGRRQKKEALSEIAGLAERGTSPL